MSLSRAGLSEILLWKSPSSATHHRGCLELVRARMAFERPVSEGLRPHPGEETGLLFPPPFSRGAPAVEYVPHSTMLCALALVASAAARREGGVLMQASAAVGFGVSDDDLGATSPASGGPLSIRAFLALPSSSRQGRSRLSRAAGRRTLTPSDDEDEAWALASGPRPRGEPEEEAEKALFKPETRRVDGQGRAEKYSEGTGRHGRSS
ncbi:hypothetical protein HPB51_021051 [Rhipicephalus microplus]|uniref:Uncharacterized protein n=1 Tax=Rhipicephalus microplus TaxID=6941 RepID=A0A9J6EBX8_RHIMP|nr:hypothetical protein HPB51_021051 [Rhipicephalus microplus]